MKKMIGFLVLVSLAFFSPAWADIYSPTDDAYVLSRNPAVTGNGGTFNIGVTAVSGFQRTFLKFDLSSYASIESATLNLYAYTVTGAYDVLPVISAYSTSNSWSETSVTWNNQPAYSGSPVNTTLGRNAGWYTWDVTSLADTAAGDMFSLVMLGPYTVRGFYSDESTFAAYRPYLDVTGTAASVPEPGILLLLVPGLVGAITFRRTLGK